MSEILLFKLYSDFLKRRYYYKSANIQEEEIILKNGWRFNKVCKVWVNEWTELEKGEYLRVIFSNRRCLVVQYPGTTPTNHTSAQTKMATWWRPLIAKTSWTHVMKVQEILLDEISHITAILSLSHTTYIYIYLLSLIFAFCFSVIFILFLLFSCFVLYLSFL